MKLFRNLLLLFSFIVLFTGCETDFDVNATWKDITVVYGILNQNDTVHYIRIQKAFLGPGNALQMAAIADSNLYPSNLRVQLEEWNGIILMRTMQLDTTSVLHKEQGIFFNPVQPVYFIKTALQPNFEYRLKILNLTTQKEITSRTQLVRDFTIDRPGFGQNLNFTAAPETPLLVRFYSALYGKRYQVTMRFNYKEVKTGTTDTLMKFIDWVSPIIKSNSLNGGETMEVKINKSVLFTMITNHIPIKPDVTRFPGLIELFFHAAADDLNTFIEVNEPSSGLVQEKPEFTNIENGIGIFSSRYSKARAHRLHPSTIDQIVAMEGYNFQWIPVK